MVTNWQRIWNLLDLRLSWEACDVCYCRRSIDDQEFLAGVVCLAVPVGDSDGGLRAALAISAPAARLSIGKALQQLPFMMLTADKLGEQFSRQRPAESVED